MSGALRPHSFHDGPSAVPTVVDPESRPSSSHRQDKSSPHSDTPRIDVGFFDPAGVDQLRQSLTTSPVIERREADFQRDTDADSDITLGIHDGNFDLERMVRQIIKRRDEANLQHRELGVAFRDLRVEGLAASSSHQPTLGSAFNPANILEAIQTLRHPPIKTILKDFEGVIRPGQMLLVLGSPGSGCSTLLKTLANQRRDFLSVSGTVHYDSLSSSDIERHFRGDVQYCPEDDIHFPTLTVEQTLSFAAKMRTPHERLPGVTREKHVELTTDMLTSIFGLRHTRKTPVGDAVIRGVSGGEKKRVSIAENLAMRSCIGVWDNSTRGLDSSTALEFVRALRIATDTFKMTTIVSLYQAGESLYELFDKVCVIDQGQMVYFGPTNQARQHFIDMGYQPANRQTTPDFLVAVTDPTARTPRPDIIQAASTALLPRTADDFAEYFRKSHLGAANREDVDSYINEFVGKPNRASAYIESARAERAKHMRRASPYTVSIAMQARGVMLRRVQIIRGNMLITGINIFSFVFQALIVGSVFVQVPEVTSAFFSRGGVLFFALLFSALTTMAEIPALYAQRPIVHRHSNAALYHPFVEALALTLVDVPITFLITIIFGIILYFLVGLQTSAAQFFIFYLFLFSLSITMKGWFRAIAAAFKSEATAMSFAGVSVLALAIYTGYTIPKPSMIGALRWLTYLNPLTYGFEAVMTNEFRTLQGACSNLVPQGPGYENVSLANQVCATLGSVPAQSFVDGSRFVELAYGFSYSHTWRNFGVVIIFAVGFIIALLVFTEFNTSMANETAVTLFKRGSRRSAPSSQSNDEESNKKEKTHPHEQHIEPETEKETPSAQPPKMTDIFSWQHVNYTVPIQGGEDRQLLSDVSGFVAPGKLTALMGESGAGKTTLLNVLAQRVSTGVVSGDRFVNGQALPADFQSQTGYVQQMDTHLPTATVREALLFSAKLRQPPSVPLAEKEAYVEKCLQMCGLEAYGDAIVGSLGVEHRKRTTIAVELAAKPKLLLFLDEPTSGLDSQSAWSIMTFLRNLADHGQAILCTIHQPSAELFQVFDRLLLLQKGGKTAYFGDLGHNATTLIDYFEKSGSRHCLPEENPAEFMLDVIGAGATAHSKQNWNQIWLDSAEARQVQQEVDTIHSEGRGRSAVEVTFHSEFATSWMTQAKELVKRNAQSYWRDPTYLIAKLVLNIAGGLFIGFTFFKAKDTSQGTQNKLFSIFMVTILSAPLSNQIQVPFIATRTIYEIRERPSRMYSWTALVTSQLLVEIPWNIVGSNLLFFCWYWTVGFDNSRAGYTYLMLTIIYPLYYTTMSQAVAAMSPSAEIAAVLFSLLFTFVLTFNGVLQPFRELGWWKWMYHLSPYTYLIEGLLGQLLGHKEMHCAPVEFVPLNPPSGQTCAQYMDKFISVAGGYLANPEASSACQFCTVKSSDQFLASSFNIFYDNHWRDFGFMIAYIAFNAFCIFLFTYLFRIRTGSIFSFLRRRK